eukprot:scaffold33685_cov22-Prasinocladus_malaysianus.AAC.1
MGGLCTGGWAAAYLDVAQPARGPPGGSRGVDGGPLAGAACALALQPADGLRLRVAAEGAGDACVVSA